MFDIQPTIAWGKYFDGSCIGILLVSEFNDLGDTSSLDNRKKEIELQLQKEYTDFKRQDFLKIPVLKAYSDYYKQFGNTYHVQGQLESIVSKKRSLPKVNALVDANFMAELETLVLTAGHDVDKLVFPIKLDVSQGIEEFIQMNGSQKILKANDMMMVDAEGVVCTILHGQDKRTAISKDTKRALYVAYAPIGVSQDLVKKQLETIYTNILLVSPNAKLEQSEVFLASDYNV